MPSFLYDHGKKYIFFTHVLLLMGKKTQFIGHVGQNLSNVSNN